VAAPLSGSAVHVRIASLSGIVVKPSLLPRVRQSLSATLGAAVIDGAMTAAEHSLPVAGTSGC